VQSRQGTADRWIFRFYESFMQRDQAEHSVGYLAAARIILLTGIIIESSFGAT
jgi:hypothetical protein